MAEKASRHVYEIYVRTTVTKLWDAITRFEVVRTYFYGYGLEAELKPGAPLAYVNRRGQKAIVGEIVSVVPRKRLVQFTHNKRTMEPPSRVTYEITRAMGVVKLTLIHDRLERSPRTFKSVRSGWIPIVNGLKTLLETGKPLFKGGM